MSSLASYQRKVRLWKKQHRECYWCMREVDPGSVFCLKHRQQNLQRQLAYLERKRMNA